MTGIGLDLAAASRFLDLMAEGEAVTFQTFDDDKERKSNALAAVFHGDLEQHQKRLQAFNERGAGIFWTVNFTDGGGRKAENVTGIRCLFLDLDGAPLQPVLAVGPEPHAVVESSPGKWHVYWQVTGCPLEKFKGAQLALAAKYNGDTSVHDLPRVLRLPGFAHRKGEPFVSRIVSLEPIQPYAFDALVQRLGIDLSAPPPSRPYVAHEPHELSDEQLQPDQLVDLRSALHALDADDRATWVENGQRLKRLGDVGRELWLAWSSTSEKFDSDDAERVWTSLEGARTAYKAIFAAAQAKGWVNPAKRSSVDSDDAAARRAEQRKRAQDIGDGTADAVPMADQLTIDEMLDQNVYISDGARVARRDLPYIALPLSEFKLHTAASLTRVGKKLMPTADLWVQAPDRITTHTLTFRPGHGEFTTDPEGAPALNLWKPRERPASTASVQPFLDHVAYLVPEQAERERFLDWLAHIEQKPGVLPHTHYLMVTPQTGIGRNWLASLLARVFAGATRLGFDLIGAMNSGFNGPLSRRLLVIVDPKYGRQHVEFNCARFLMLSQHFDALPLEKADRRVIVISNPTERMPVEYYRKLYAMLDDVDFVNAVAAWLAQRDISSFNPSEPAPMTDSKKQAVEACMSDVERALIDLRDGTKARLMTSADIGQYLEDCGLRVLQGRGLAAAYAAAGLVRCTRMVTLFGKKHRVVALRDGDKLKEASSDHLFAVLKEKWD